ncbi:hypothetical protein M8T02_20660, partial [Enterobacter hormaechei]|nr:hypothetical protein [Enterobacter hormaechei]
EWVHVQLHQQKGMISLSPPTICNSALRLTFDDNGMDTVCCKSHTIFQNPVAVFVESTFGTGSSAPHFNLLV